MKLTKYLFFIVLIVPLFLIAELGVCVVPVADLLGDPFEGNAHSIERAYQNIPLSGDAQLVRRMGQLLFNELVTIVRERDAQVCVRVPHMFYCTERNRMPHRLFWTLKKNIRPLACMQDISCIPPSFDSNLDASKIVVLRRPWYDRAYGRWCSVGTRFVINEQKRARKNQRAVYTLAPRGRVATVYIPGAYCIDAQARLDTEKRQLFVEVLKGLAHPERGIVPYAWGGMSFVAPHGLSFTQIRHEELGKPLLVEYRAHRSYNGAYAGFDCAALIVRAAQIANIAWCGRNTWAFKYYLPVLRADQEPEIGDIIYIPGHVMVLSDLAHGLIIEARTQAHGYGFVHEIPLSEEFVGIHTIHDLVKAYHAHTNIARIDRNGSVITRVPLIILKLLP